MQRIYERFVRTVQGVIEIIEMFWKGMPDRE